MISPGLNIMHTHVHKLTLSVYMVHFIYYMYMYIVCLSLDMCTAQAGFDGDSVYDETHTVSLLNEGVYW